MFEWNLIKICSYGSNCSKPVVVQAKAWRRTINNPLPDIMLGKMYEVGRRHWATINQKRTICQIHVTLFDIRPILMLSVSILFQEAISYGIKDSLLRTSYHSMISYAVKIVQSNH